MQSAVNWRGGKGDVLREFVDAAQRWNIKICYYINPMTDGYLANGRFFPLFLRFSIGKCRDCPFFRAF